MSRLLAMTAVLFALIGSSTTQVEAADTKRAICEGYCLAVTAGCYVYMGLFVGRESCELMYEGCVNGCVSAIVEAE